VRVFLDNGDGRLSDTRLVVLAFNAPYYLDTTQISKLTLYLAAYSKTPPSIEAAVRALFGEFVPRGHSPVDVEGINYDLLRQLAPDPTRPIAISLLDPQGGDSLQAPTAVRLQAGPLMDGNGNLVPDGTEVTFEAAYETGNQYLPAIGALTKAGLAEVSFNLRQPGTVVFSAHGGDSARGEGPRLLLVPPPTPTASPSATPSSTPAPAATATLTPSPIPERATANPAPLPAGPPPASPGGSNGENLPLGPRAGRLLLALLGMAVAELLGFLLLGLWAARPAQRVRWALLCISGGMAGYILYLLLLPGAWQIPPAAGGLALLGALGTLPLARAGAIERHA
jgi:beta-N-acetylhexosaminidase